MRHTNKILATLVLAASLPVAANTMQGPSIFDGLSNTIQLGEILGIFHFPGIQDGTSNTIQLPECGYHPPKTTPPVPEPGTLALVGFGVAAVAGAALRRSSR